MGIGSAKQYKGQPQKDWNKNDWLQHAWVQSHNPWISEEDRQYWRDKIAELSNN